MAEIWILDEFRKLITQEGWMNLFFVIPNVRMVRGYYATEMKIISLGHIKEIKPSILTTKEDEKKSHDFIYFQNRSPIPLRSTHQFIRWLGL